MCLKRLFQKAIAVAAVALTAVAAQAAELTDVIARVKPAVATLRIETDRGTATGTGFFVSRDGKLMTAWHVIQGMRRGVVILADGRQLPIRSVLSGDPSRDCAVVQVTGTNFRTVPLGDSSRVREGQNVVALGSPLGERMLQLSVTRGIVSGLRDFPGQGKHIQTDAPISPGNSGGPLLDMDGRAIGIITFKIEGQPYNFALSINEAKPWLTQLRLPAGMSARPAPGANAPSESALERAKRVLRTDADDKYRRALPLLEQAVRENPYDPTAWALTGMTLLALDRTREALTATLTAYRLDPRHEIALMNLVLIGVLTGDHRLANRAMEELEDVNPRTAADLRRRLER